MVAASTPAGAQSRTAAPVLTDGLVTLRPHRPDDAPAIVEQCNDPDTVRFTPIPQPYGVEQAHEYLDRCATDWRSADPMSPRVWAIETSDRDGRPRYAGSCAYQPEGPGTAAVGYLMHPWARGRGLAARALRLLCEHAFDAGLQILVWRAVEGNWASRRTAWRCGFSVEGHVRGGLPGRPGTTPQGAWLGSLSRDDPRQPPNPWHRVPTLSGHLGEPDRPRAITLRPWREDDVLPEEADAANERFLAGLVPTAATYRPWLADRLERQAQGDRMDWCIVDATDTVVGSVWLYDLRRRLRAGTGAVGFWLYPRARRRGVARAALAAVLEHAFAPEQAGGLGLRRVRADADVTNRACLRTLLATGFATTGVARRDRLEPDGRVADMMGFELLAGRPRPDESAWGPDDAHGADPMRRAHARRLALLALTPQVGRRLTLRPFDDGDTDAVVRMLREPDLGPWSSPDAGWDQARDWLRAADTDLALGTRLRWAIVVDGRALGVLSLHGIDGRQALGQSDPRRVDGAELGYWLSATSRREGLTSRAVALAIDHAMRPLDQGGLGLRRLTATTTADNVASRRILESAGFVRWGIEPATSPEAEAIDAAAHAVTPGESPATWHYRYSTAPA